MSKKSILLCWHSYNYGKSVLDNCLRLLKEQGSEADYVYYLTSPVEPEKLKKVPLPVPDNYDIPIKVMEQPLTDPTAHEAIYKRMKEVVIPELKKLNPGSIHINISPGTPAMHSVWLILFAAGEFPEGTKLWSTQYIRESDKTIINSINFDINTYLKEIKRFSSRNPGLAIYHPDNVRSLPLKSALNKLGRYAALKNAPILVTGERGTGKTRLIETIAGSIKSKKVVTVACGTLQPELAMSQLFGYVKGAFTGANKDSEGYIAEAKDNILFLDEIQDLPKDVQRKLVRFLQDPEHRYARLGEHDMEHKSNVEIICASHMELSALRERLDYDFFDRISLLFIELPALRECREDMQEVWCQVWDEMRTSSGIDKEPIWDEIVESALGKSPLSGNIRDLQRLALLIMANQQESGDYSRVEEAIEEWLEIQKRLESSEQKESLVSFDFYSSKSWQEREREFKQELAEAACEHYGSIKEAAEALSMNAKTLSNNRRGGE